uniref:AA_permease domain-containing protein n=1 Tax=Globodera pallida TaxID=36090 RepID=A0A183CAV1_GLOPA
MHDNGPVSVLLQHQQQQQQQPSTAATNGPKQYQQQHNGGASTAASSTRLAMESAEHEPLCAKQSHQNNMALYEDDCSKGQNIGPNVAFAGAASAAASNGGVKGGGEREQRNGRRRRRRHKSRQKRQTAKLGTIMGVYIPCLQNIFGVLFFIRLPWIVGTAGILEAFMVVLLCCSVFYLGTTVAASMYIIGAVEIFLIYIMPQAKVFEDMYHNFRLFGSLLLILVGLIVLAGVKIVNKFALPAVLIVIACIVFTFVGIFLKFDGSDSLQFCMVGNRPVDLSGFERQKGFVPECSAEGLRKTDARGEPIRAIFLTLFICWLGILVAVIENITALITQFFLMCYLGVNAACALQKSGALSIRPRGLRVQRPPNAQ